VTPSYEVRNVAVTDLATVADLAHRLWNEHYPGIISQAQIDYMLADGYNEATLRADLARGVLMRLLVVDGEPVGFSASERVADDVVKLHKLYLAKSQRGRGLGSVLMDDCEQFARDVGARFIRLQVNKNNHVAITAYRGKGFYEHESVVVDIGGGFVMDDFVLEKTVTP